MKFTIAALMATLPVASTRLAASRDLGEGCECASDYDCLPKCIFNPYTNVGICSEDPNPPSPTPPSTSPPFGGGEPCPCENPKTIPTECEVRILIKMMDIAVSGDHKRAAQWLRASFHDAGTFNQNFSEGGANGCLMNHPPMLAQGENAFLDVPVAALETIKNNWMAHPKTCIKISSADIIQFAGLFATVRQRGPTAGVLDSSKMNKLLEFEWGRTDEPDCDINWTDNLPGFNTPSSGGPIAGRCTGAGGEIKEKMMDRNGFTALHASALIGAHTIGRTRSTFPGFSSPWVPNGADNATPDGPVFDNAFHDFLISTIVANDAVTFGSNPPASVAPFTSIFPNWFRDDPNDLNHLDTDVTLAFDSLDTNIHPHFRPDSIEMAASNEYFLKIFDAAYDKMSRLGVEADLFPPTECDPCEVSADIFVVQDVVTLVSDLGTATADAEDKLEDKLKVQRDELLKNTIELLPTDIPHPIEAPVMAPSPRELTSARDETLVTESNMEP